MWLGYALSISATILLILAIWIYGVQKKDAYRFFYPALVLFVLFSLVPISYSIYVSFTNLKTGHLLERKDVVKLFVDEKMVEKDAPLLNFVFTKSSDNYVLVLKDGNLTYAGPLGAKDNKEKVINLIEVQPTADNGVISPGEVLDILEKYPALKVIHPVLGELSFYRSDILTKIKPRYTRLADDQFKDNITEEIITEDTVNGQFKNQDEAVGPGYFTFAGLSNYKELFFDPITKLVFMKSLSWTFSWAFLSVLLTFSLGAFLAVVLNDLGGKSKFVYRMIFIIPYSIPFFISVLIFKGMLNKDFGEINSFLAIFKVSPVPWLENKIWARVSVLMVNLWLGFPYMLLVITGIIQSIPKSIYEASSLEGATKFQNFRFLTFPLVIRAMIPLLIGSFAFNLNNFVGIYLLTGGGPVIPDISTPLGETDILISYTYRLAFEGAQGQNFAMAATVSMLIFVIVLVLTLLNFKVSKALKK